VKLLALDTSTDACTVAVLHDQEVTSRHVVEPRAHTRILLPMIRELLTGRDLTVADLDAIVLGNGPGSFIGMRIGASVAQGLAYGADLPMVPVSSLETVAAEVFATRDVSEVLVGQDARMSELYVARYRRGDDDLPVAVGETELVSAATANPEDEDVCLAGGGWFDRKAEASSMPPDAVLRPDARYLLACGRRDFIAGQTVTPDALVPAYVRMTVAAVPASGRGD